MITKFKIYEQSLNEGVPELYDYVLVEDENTDNDKIRDFLENNIGQIVDNSVEYLGNFDFLVKYDLNFEYDCFSDKINKTYGFSKDSFQISQHPEGCRMFKKSEIKYWSKYKENLTPILTAKKFNI